MFQNELLLTSPGKTAPLLFVIVNIVSSWIGLGREEIMPFFLQAAGAEGGWSLLKM